MPQFNSVGGKVFMINLYSSIRNGNRFPKLEVDELMAVQYTCMHDEMQIDVWSHHNYFAFITSGKKAWQTIHNTYEVKRGDILFVKKGATITHQFFKEEFCAILIFIPDEFIKTVIQKHQLLIHNTHHHSGQDSVLMVEPDELLDMYASTIQSYLFLTENPGKALLKLKFEELLLSLFAHEKHREITDYFVTLCQDKEYHLSRIMEENYAYNLNVEEYAQLCNMSLSAFKTAFKQYYKTTPAAWLKEKKLTSAHHRLLSSDLPISQIAFEYGFEDTSHFIRVFKRKYQLTPFQYRHTYAESHMVEI